MQGRRTSFHQDSKTIVADHQQLRSAISAEAISSHARPIRSFLSLLTARLPELGATALIFARFDTSPPAASGLWGGKPERLLPEMILRLLCSVVNPKRAEIGSSTNQTVLAAHSGIPILISALMISW